MSLKAGGERVGGRLKRLQRLERLKLSAGALRMVRSARLAHLATADAGGHPHVIPICFAFNGKKFFSPIDEKPKRAAPTKLRRLRNIEVNPRVAIVVDHYEEDWKKLGYVLVFGTARILLGGKGHRDAVRLLRRKYPQYRNMAIHERPMIVIRPTRLSTWGRPLISSSSPGKHFHRSRNAPQKNVRFIIRPSDARARR